MTAISLLSIGVDSPPDQISLDPNLLLRLEVGIHIDLSDAPEETLRTIGRCFLQAARVKANRRLPEVA